MHHVVYIYIYVYTIPLHTCSMNVETARLCFASDGTLCAAILVGEFVAFESLTCSEPPEEKRGYEFPQKSAILANYTTITRTHTHTHTHSHKQTHTHTHTHSYMYVYTHIHIFTNTHTHTGQQRILQLWKPSI